LTCNALPGTPGAATALFSDNDGFQEWLRTGDAVETTTTEIVDTTTGNIPEPTLLTLLGVGLAAASRRFRRRTA
jgi:MYXO-CTERM domain-containing protein